MSQELVAIRFKQFRKGPNNKYADYPDFKRNLAFFQNPDNLKLEKTMHYDKTSGCGSETPDSPLGSRFIMKLVPEEFALQAVAAFGPEGTVDSKYEVTILDEAEAQDFYDNKANAHVSDNKFDVDVLQGLKLQLDLMKELGQSTTDVEAEIAKAIDPEIDSPGVRKNKRKTWARMVADKKINLKSKAALGI